jgi:4-oxalocrotonate tautomerase
MPHVNIKHFPTELSEERQSELVLAVTQAVRNAFGCDEGVISIALEPVTKDDWNELVYGPEIEQRRDLLRKIPSY